MTSRGHPKGGESSRAPKTEDRKRPRNRDDTKHSASTSRNLSKSPTTSNSPPCRLNDPSFEDQSEHNSSKRLKVQAKHKHQGRKQPREDDTETEDVSGGYSLSAKPSLISVKLGAKSDNKLLKMKSALAHVFNSDDEEEEEIPIEAKMRMRNIGRDTPTSAGPNSFGKTKKGFVDAKHAYERKLKEDMDRVSGD